MPDCILSMKTKTAAERARRLLPRGTGVIVSLDPSVTGTGCSYGVRFPCRFAQKLQNELDRQGIPHGHLIGGGGNG